MVNVSSNLVQTSKNERFGRLVKVGVLLSDRVVSFDGTRLASLILYTYISNLFC